MFQAWRMQIRAAEEALRQGRLDDAARKVCQGSLGEFLPALQLQGRIAGQMLDRAKLRLKCDESAACWQDLVAAERLGADLNDVATLRQTLINRTLEEVEALLAADEPAAAVARLDWLARRTVTTRKVRAIRLAAEKAAVARRPVRGTIPAMCPMESSPKPGSRFWLWVDGVGGFLVCEAGSVTLGQPLADGPADIPIQADLSRKHAVIRRDGEGYSIAPCRRTQVGGCLISGPEILTDGCLIELGEGVRLRFRRPHPLSATARLDFVSHHRTKPTADGVLLLAESLILGPSSASHIVCPDWPDDIVLFRQEGELFCRAQDAIVVDGMERGRQAAIHRAARIAVGDRTLSLERL